MIIEYDASGLARRLVWRASIDGQHSGKVIYTCPLCGADTGWKNDSSDKGGYCGSCRQRWYGKPIPKEAKA